VEGGGVPKRGLLDIQGFMPYWLDPRTTGAADIVRNSCTLDGMLMLTGPNMGGGWRAGGGHLCSAEPLQRVVVHMAGNVASSAAVCSCTHESPVLHAPLPAAPQLSVYNRCWHGDCQRQC
jgi:hypothetical protein